MKDERGFILIETLCALLVLALGVLLISELWQAASAEDRRSELQVAVSRTAVSKMETWRAEDKVPVGSSTQVLTVDQVHVTETSQVTMQNGLTEIQLTYSWQEGGRSFAQTYATLHP